MNSKLTNMYYKDMNHAEYYSHINRKQIKNAFSSGSIESSHYINAKRARHIVDRRELKIHYKDRKYKVPATFFKRFIEIQGAIIE